MNLPSWYDSWLTNEPEPDKQCRCGNIMEWSLRCEVWFCPDCDSDVNEMEIEKEVQP